MRKRTQCLCSVYIYIHVSNHPGFFLALLESFCTCLLYHPLRICIPWLFLVSTKVVAFFICLRPANDISYITPPLSVPLNWGPTWLI